MIAVPRVQMAPDGPAFSRLVQGYWRLADWHLTPEALRDFVAAHVDMGLTTVDHAAIYGDPPCEALFGAALRLDPGLRQRIEIVSKCGIIPGATAPPERVGHYDSGRESILASVETSLSRLGTDYLDVLLLHRCDYLMAVDEVAEAFTELHQAGKVRHFGVSNFTPAQFSLLQSRLERPLVTNQVEINPVNFAVTEDGTLDQLQERRVRPMAWSCLAGGAIFHGDTEQVRRLRATLADLRTEMGAESIDQVIYAWIVNMPSGPVPIVGSGNLARIAAAVAALDLTMSREQWYRLWVAARGHGVP